MRTEKINISELYWHDGVITKLVFNPNYESQGEIALYVDLFSDPENTSDRDALQITCSDVVRYIATCDLFELNENKGAGNILDGWVTGKILRISLFGGYIEIESNTYEVERPLIYS